MNVPKIRYDNFTKEWEKVKLSSQASFLQGLTYTPNDVSNDGTIVLRSSNIQNSMVDYNDIVRVNIIIPEKLKIKENDILMCVRNGSKSLVGKTAWLSKNEEKCTWGAFMNIIRPKEKNKFVYYYLNSKYFYNHVWKDLGTATVNQITKQTLESCYLNIPSIEEQEKISNTLSLLDQKIKLQSKKIEDLKLFKLYIRKKIFSSNTNNNIRLKEIVNCESSNITLADIENDNGIYPVYGATGFIKNIKNYKFDSEYIAIVKDGAGVGRTMICPKNSSILATMNALTIKNNYPLNYICEIINTISFDKYIVGSGIPHIYFKDYGNEEFMLHNENDANKFDSVFKCLDRKIELLNVSLDKLNILKKGLMQGMFVELVNKK